MTRSVALEAPAKINLRLAILAREVSGYHSLETLFCGVSLADRVSVAVGEHDVQLEVDGEPPTANPEHNLAVRAARRFYRELGTEPRLRLRIEKAIPAAAGLGGGSSDAAATLRALNELHDRPIRPESLLAMGAELGSDVPFFLTDSPFALAWGRGERLLPLDPLPARTVLIVHPGEPLATPAVFKRYSELLGDDAKPVAHALPASALTSWERLPEYAINDLELAAFEKVPRLPHALRALLDAGASITMLAGSGSAIFGIFPLDAHLRSVTRTLTRNAFTCWTAQTLESWPSPTFGD